MPRGNPPYMLDSIEAGRPPHRNKTDAPYLHRLLCAPRNRPCGSRSAEKGDEVAALPQTEMHGFPTSLASIKKTHPKPL